VKFTDAKTSQLLSVLATRIDVRDFSIEKTIYVSSDKPGWPVDTEWIDHTETDWNLLSNGAAPR